MAENEGEEAAPKPYLWDEGPPATPEALQMWVEVGNGLDKNSTVVWKNAVESLDHTLQFLTSEPRAREFCERYMATIIGILVEQVPSKIGVHERNCVQESLILSVRIVAKDLAIQVQRGGTCELLPTLSHVFNKKKAFYKGGKGATSTSWSVNHHPLVGMPEVRLRTMEHFRQEGGFQRLHEYLQLLLEKQQTAKAPPFPTLTWLHDILVALGDSVSPRATAGADATASDAAQEEAILLSKVVMQYIGNCSEEDLKKLPSDELKVIQMDLQRIFDRLVATRRSNTHEFYDFWRSLVLGMITSKSLPLKLFGWEQVGDLIRACEAHRPPPRSFEATGAGCVFANGTYEFAGEVTPDGYARQGLEFKYVHQVPDTGPPEMAGKKLTLFRCTMRSQQKWWFLSEADEEQPGTDRDVDFYQHKAKDWEEAYPPTVGWITCRNSGVDPAPVLESSGVLVPSGAEFKTLEHQLAKWAIENEIVEQVLGDTTIHREVVSRSTVLIKFLASMCTRVGDPNGMYCLQASHLLFAWKTCTRKADAAVSLQVYQLLVSILPLCPSSLAIPLLQAVQTSLHESGEKRDYLFEVSEFCSALADGTLVDSKHSTRAALSDQVREEALNLLWSVLTHPGASSLKSYESLKAYFTHEIKVEPKGSEHREQFLRSCIDTVEKNQQVRTAQLNEVQALRMVKLLDFVLEACPRNQAEKIANNDESALPWLVFQELAAYMDRLKNTGHPQGAEEWKHPDALQERLRILRHVFGLSMQPLGAPALKELWERCVAPSDREAVMVFVSSASQSGNKNPKVEAVGAAGAQTQNLLSPALTEDVCHKVFLDLFCAPSFDYDELGESGYRSFQFLFSQMRRSTLPAPSKKIALDALWRFCLTVGKDAVAEQAMKNLLAVYVSRRNAPASSANGLENSTEHMAIDEVDENFESRIYECLARLKNELGSGSASAELSAQRCLRILKAAIGENLQDNLATASTLARMVHLPIDASLEDAIRCLPHGMRGQASYRRVGIIAKGANQQKSSMSKFPLDVHPLETLASLKAKVASTCQCHVSSVKPVQINGRSLGTGLRAPPGDPAHVNLNVVPEDSVMDQLGVVQGCEIVFVIADRPMQSNTAVSPSQPPFSNDLSSYFFARDGRFADRLFTLLLGILESLRKNSVRMETTKEEAVDTHKLVWDLLLAMPTDVVIARKLKSVRSHDGLPGGSEDAMQVDSSSETWSQLLDAQHFERSVYVLLTIDAFLQPAPEALSTLPEAQRAAHERTMVDGANKFRRMFIDAGGFAAVVRFFSAAGSEEATKQSKTRRGNAVALRILKSCLFGNDRESDRMDEAGGVSADEAGMRLLQSLTDVEGLLRSLTSMVVDDDGISSSTVSDVLRFLWLLFRSPRAAESFVSLAGAEKFLVVLLLWDGGTDATRTGSSASAAMQVRKTTHDLVLQFPQLVERALPWLMNAITGIDTSLDSTSEFFDVLERLVEKDGSETDLRDLAVIVCKKLAACPRPTSEMDLIEYSTGVLCGCLKLLRALIAKGGGKVLRDASGILYSGLQIEERWPGASSSSNRGVLSMVAAPFGSRARSDDAALLDVMGAIFDGFLSPNTSTGIAICCDKDSRRRGFEVVSAASRACTSSEGYVALLNRVNGLISSTAPRLRHHWGQFGGAGEQRGRGRSSSKYSGLRNQGCTCYMNSFLQQMFMMPELRDSLCSAPLPSSLRSSGSSTAGAGEELVGKKISLQWDTAASYDAIVESFDKATGMHTIRYLPIQVATVGNSNHQQVRPEDVAQLSPALPDEFILSEGRPGKETGVFELVNDPVETDSNGMKTETVDEEAIKETEDESLSRHLLEEVQRTFIHLKEGSKGRCFDPRALVEACACLKLEFDVWQQNDASEFATKLLDRLEISLKKWAPDHFNYMDHTFGLKQTKQKICKECGLKTNREEKLLNIDCQIRGKSDIHEALAAVTEVEIMEGSNKVFCDSCKKNTDTVLRTAIATLPNMLILSLKRFDLDYTTFETVKLNSRCAFGHTLNMKKYTLEGLEEPGEATESNDAAGPAPMDTDDAERSGEESEKTQTSLSDEDYEYRLAGVLVHAGVAQGGHYYSFIKDKGEGEEKWFRFDDEDVTPFDPALIETECFGGKVKKETKWPNGQVHTVEQEQFANALMLFYEKVKPTDVPEQESETEEAPAPVAKNVETATGYEAFEPDVRTSNATHRWQSFLFDNEFQAFLKDILGFCRHSKAGERSPGSEVIDRSWLPPMTEMLLSFVFDVMLYGSDLTPVEDWTVGLEQLLHMDSQIAIDLVHKLARKTSSVSSNWLRTYLLDCPERTARTAAVRIFTAAFASSASLDDELRILSKWAQAWKEQVETVSKAGLSSNPNPIPCQLDGRLKAFEDVEQIGSGSSSSFGVVLSLLNTLMDAVPRSWRFSAELFMFIRNLARLSLANGTNPFRRPMVDAMIATRLVAMVARERGPAVLRAAFPSASVSQDAANTQMRAESNPTAHVVPMTTNTVLASDLNNQRGPSLSDSLVMLEAIACLGGLPGAVHAPLCFNSDEIVRSRQRHHLSEKAAAALRTIFEECCAPGAPGMGRREIESYLHRCGTDRGAASPQKIHDMLTKYPTTPEVNDGTNEVYLSLDGFLAFYRDCAQSNDVRMRMDLHACGFRPDLSRRPLSSRFMTVGDRENALTPTESVAQDVAETLGTHTFDVGKLGNMALGSIPQIFMVAYSASEPMMEYLAAASVYGKDAEPLIYRTLSLVFNTPNDWAGNERVSGAMSLLQTIASTPGEHQEKHIETIMLSRDPPDRKAAESFGSGLLEVTRYLHGVSRSNQYNNDVYLLLLRYMGILRDLRTLYPVFLWMNEHRSHWSFCERDLLDETGGHGNQRQDHYSATDADQSLPLDQSAQSDSDMAGMDDSGDDEDSHFAGMEGGGQVVPVPNNGPGKITVKGAGHPSVNGHYSQDGFFSNACRYSKTGRWNNGDYRFYIFQCHVSNNTRHWYISIVPYGGNPGTSSDIDFYSAPVTEECRQFPPQSGWVKANAGKEPPPEIVYVNDEADPHGGFVV